MTSSSSPARSRPLSPEISGTEGSEQQQSQGTLSSTARSDNSDGKYQSEPPHRSSSKTSANTEPPNVQPAGSSTTALLSDPSVSPGHIASDPRRDEFAFRSPSPMGSSQSPSNTPPPSTSWIQRARQTWLMSKGMFMVMIAQFFGASMNTMTRILELDGPHGKALNAFEILFVRMFATAACSLVYMWYAKVPHPFGIRPVRLLLFIRGIAGFFGVFGLYYSLVYLPLSEATVLTFLAPILSCYACSWIIPGEVFTGKQQIAGVLSLIGVILIARPISLFTGGDDSSSEGEPLQDATLYVSSNFSSINNSTTSDPNSSSDDVDSEQRLLAIVAALVGVLGATVAYTTIRQIGQRAHALVSVTYFSISATIISVVVVLAVPSVSFRLPSNWTEIFLLLGLGVCGFVMQFLLTAGLAYVPPPNATQSNSSRSRSGSGGSGSETEKGEPSVQGSRATSMVYTQMLFALFYDKLVWDSTPSALSWTGSGIILGSAIYVALVQTGDGTNEKDANTKGRRNEERQDENTGINVGEEHVGADVESGTSGRRRGRGAWWRRWLWPIRRASSRHDDDGDEHEDGHEYERRALLHEGYDDEEDEHR